MTAAIANNLAASAAEGNTASPKLVKAAQDFESMMLKELLKPLGSSAGGDGDDPDSDAGSGTALGEFASEALGRSLSQHGGFGIANRILHDLSQSGNTTQSGKVTTILHDDTVVRTSE